jgi:hypothetical protein
MSNEKYPDLSLISALYKIFGWINLLAGIACVAWAIFGSSTYDALTLAMSTFFLALFLFAIGGALNVLVDIEFNTRSGNKAEQQTHHRNNILEKFLEIPKSERPKWLPYCPRCRRDLKEGATGCASCRFLFSEWQ